MLHDELHVLEQAHVGERIAADGDDVGILAGRDGADRVRTADQVRGVDGRGADRGGRASCRCGP
jgi:hypothetical protein